MKDLPAIVSPKKAFKKPYLIWESGKSLWDGTEKNLEELREAAKQRKFYIFANDAKRVELLVCGQPSKLKVGETFSWATLYDLWNTMTFLGSHQQNLSNTYRTRLRHGAGEFTRHRLRVCKACRQLLLS